MTDIIAFQLRFGTAFIHNFKYALLIVEGVFEHQVLGRLQVWLFPVAFVFFDAGHHREETKIDRAHVNGIMVSLKDEIQLLFSSRRPLPLTREFNNPKAHISNYSVFQHCGWSEAPNLMRIILPAPTHF